MVSLSALWLPIVLSAVIVFVASSLIHMLLGYHSSDYHALPQEDKLMGLLRPDNLKPGLYVFPYCKPKDMKSPAAVEKYKVGPVGHLNIVPNGPPSMPKFLGQWFGFLLVVGFFVAYLAGHTLPEGTHYPTVFRVVPRLKLLCAKPEVPVVTSLRNSSRWRFKSAKTANWRARFHSEGAEKFNVAPGVALDTRKWKVSK